WALVVAVVLDGGYQLNRRGRDRPRRMARTEGAEIVWIHAIWVPLTDRSAAWFFGLWEGSHSSMSGWYVASGGDCVQTNNGAPANSRVVSISALRTHWRSARTPRAVVCSAGAIHRGRRTGPERLVPPLELSLCSVLRTTVSHLYKAD